MMVINNEISMMAYNIDKIKADYKAEIAINEAIRKIEDNNEINCSELENVSGSLIEENDHYIKTADKKEQEEGYVFLLKAKGISGLTNSKLKIEVIN